MEGVEIQLAPLYITMARGVERPYCLNYMNSSGELASTRFTYDRKGRNDRAFYQNITGGRSSANVHEFDKDDRIIRKFRKYNDGLSSTELFVYDAEGRLDTETYEDSTGTSGSAAYAYDDSGNAARIHCEGYKGWLSGELRFTFDSKGKRLAGTLLKDGEPAGEITYQYDSKGNLLQEHWDLAGTWSQTLRYVYEAAP